MGCRCEVEPLKIGEVLIGEVYDKEHGHYCLSKDLMQCPRCGRISLHPETPKK